MSKQYTLSELRDLDVTTLDPADIADVTRQVMVKMKTFKNVIDDLDTQRKALFPLADLHIIKDNEEVVTAFGKYTKKPKQYMVLPSDEDGGKDAAIQYAVDLANAGTPVDEAFAGFSVSLKLTGWKDVETEDLPVGIGRSEEDVIRFTPSK